MRLVLLSSIAIGVLQFETCYAPIPAMRMVETVGVVHDSDAQKQQSPVDRFMLRANPRLNAWTAREKIECIFSIFFPPVAVLYHGGRGDVLHYVLNIVLWILGWVPGTIHAVWYCFYR